MIVKSIHNIYNIQETNELIGEFCFGKSEKNPFGQLYYPKANNTVLGESILCRRNCQDIFSGELEFDQSWDWLMEAVELVECKFSTKDYLPRFSISSHCVSLYLEEKGEPITAGSYPNGGEKINFVDRFDATYYVVVEFIKWFNKRKGGNYAL